MTAQRPLDSEELASTAPEREVLEAFLDAYRAELAGALRGVSEEQARRRLVPSRTTLVGLVKHAAAVERNWFFHTLARLPREQIAGNSTGDDASWDVRPTETLADVVAEYEDVCRQSRRLAADVDLGDTVPHPRLGMVSLRYVYVHLIRELARHCGHADILREQLGVTAQG
ncbi:DinB family protein [Jidongwangia harbinensis]|uniref:DinB family protein n=1 Tax=Jidongwangia harbinensis TaxID=2878561 RepID=UPI001CD9B396|nr:DinB family protein [Jidongwangia harbinensis]MCA2218108.1 DinB family protein [Jidongwangia harbinensis]